MAAYTLLLLEATGIQEYIFGSNELAQNIGASELVTQATSLWVFETLDRLKLPHNVPRQGSEYVIDAETGHYRIGDSSINAGGLRAEVIYAGGGNSLVLFADATDAKEFAGILTRRALLEAPGLQLVLASEAFDWENGILRDQYQHLRKTLAARKSARPFSTPLVGLGATAACAFTGMPAVGIDDEGRLISATVQGKLDAERRGLQRLHDVLSEVEETDWEFVYDFDYFGKKGESSFIAVIHTDGNSMGKRVQEISAANNADYARALRRFSTSVNTAATNALRATVRMLIESRDKEGRFGGIVPTPEHKGRRQLPFRPIVFGGDDVTFVCEGRLGLALAAKYLQELARQKLNDEKPLHASAGVAVVKSHFPFSRAYDLAEELCTSAKRYLKDCKIKYGEENLAVLDWHFAVSGLIHSLGEVRRREYRVPAGKLYMRPYRLSDADKDKSHAWESFITVANEFRRKDGAWAQRRNKVKALRDALRGGKSATEQFLRIYDLKQLPEIPGRPDMKSSGWQNGNCGYFDAIEALDLYVPLEGGAR